MQNETLRKRSILIAESRRKERETLVSVLSSDYAAVTAQSAAEGLSLLRAQKEPCSLVLLGGGLGAEEVAFFLSEIRGEGFSVPVLVTVSEAEGDRTAEWLALGAAEYLTGSYSPVVLLHRVKTVLRLHEEAEALEALKHDDLCGLLTRQAFLRRVTEQLEFAFDCDYDMLMLSVKDYSHLTLRYGEANGEKLLRHIASRISSLPRQGLFCCRFSADRFVLLIPHEETDRESQLSDLGHYLHAGAPVPDFSLKYAVYSHVPHDISAELLCDRLSITLETVNSQYNRSVAYCSDEVVERANRLRRMEECMGHALGGHQFSVYYQPKIDCKTGKTVGAEALVRWIHPDFGFMSPGDFIPLFEQNGFITSLDLFVWKTVCRDIRRWRDDGLPAVPVSVNASRRDFLAVNTIDVLRKPIELSGISAKDVHLEITESFGVSDKTLLDRVKTVRDAGIQIELDDFGSGQSSLGSILDIPMDAVKLDISFVRSLDRKMEIVRMMISLAHALGLKVVAEGVETEAQASILRSLSCDMIQGYLYARPLPEAQFREYLKGTLSGKNKSPICRSRFCTRYPARNTGYIFPVFRSRFSCEIGRKIAKKAKKPLPNCRGYGIMQTGPGLFGDGNLRTAFISEKE